MQPRRVRIRPGISMIAAVALAAVALAAVVTVVPSLVDTGAPAVALADGGARANRAVFHDTMRKLWEDHITWTRLFIVSVATESAALPDLAATTDRLLANQTDIGNAMKAFYGTTAGDRLTALLRTHILLAAQLLSAAKAGDSAGVATASSAWYANADDIAAFLHAANPANWPLADLQAMMKSHLDLTLKEGVDRLGGHYAADVADYDAVHGEILQMADMLSDGIVRQFPGAFAR